VSHELVYTSVPRGLKAGSKGFCAVAMTRHISGALVERLESLSGYRPLYPPGDPQADQNPPVQAHWRIDVGGKPLHVLSRVGWAGLDYTQRANKLAHHVALDATQLTPAGPAWVLRQGVLRQTWTGEPVLMEEGMSIPDGENPPRPCEAWAALAGDAGWAGVLVEALLAREVRAAFIIYPRGADALALVDEAVALLPEDRRWDATFSTYFTELPAGATCRWRFCIADTPAAREAQQQATTGALVIDLTAPPRPAPDSPWTQAARQGRRPRPQAAAPAAPIDNGLTRRADSAPRAAVSAPAQTTILLRQGPRPLFWVIAVFWPVVVLILAMLLWPKPPRPAPDAAGPPPPPPHADDAQRTTRIAADELLGQLEEKTRRLAALEAQTTRRADWISPQQHRDALAVVARHPSTTQFAPIERYAAAERDLAAVRQLAEQLQRDVHELRSTTRGLDHAHRLLAASLPAVGGIRAATLPAIPRDAVGQIQRRAQEILSLGDGARIARLSLDLPDANGALRVEQKTDTSVLVFHLDADVARTVRRDLLELTAERGVVRAAWLSDDRPGKLAPIVAACRQALRLATLSVLDEKGTPLAMVQFIEPARLSCVLGSPSPAVQLDIADGAALDLATAPPWWAVSGQGTPQLQLTNGSAQFGLRLVTVAGSTTLVCDHKEQLLGAQASVAQQRRKADELAADLPRKAGRVDYDDMNTRHIDLFRRYHQALDAWQAARRQADSLRDVGPFHVAIRAPTGAVLALVTLTPPR
jgi:hypothetical protein